MLDLADMIGRICLSACVSAFRIRMKTYAGYPQDLTARIACARPPAHERRKGTGSSGCGRRFGFYFLAVLPDMSRSLATALTENRPSRLGYGASALQARPSHGCSLLTGTVDHEQQTKKALCRLTLDRYRTALARLMWKSDI